LCHIHARDIRVGRTQNFLPGQFAVTLLAFPLWLAGLYYLLFSRKGRRFSIIGWMYIVPLVPFIIVKGRAYYLAACYPMLYAAGSVCGEQWLSSVRRGWATAVRVLAWSALLADIAIVVALALPIAPVDSKWWNRAIKVNADLREEFGWPELAETVAGLRDSLPEADRTHFGVLAGNYGEAGAIDLYGPRFGLPPAISGINSYWQRGYGNPPPQTLIVVGLPSAFLESNFSSCQLVAHTWNRAGVENEETRDHPDIYLCHALRQSWPDFWKHFQYGFSPTRLIGLAGSLI
jgi:hypothetical protein